MRVPGNDCEALDGRRTGSISYHRPVVSEIGRRNDRCLFIFISFSVHLADWDSKMLGRYHTSDIGLSPFIYTCTYGLISPRKAV